MHTMADGVRVITDDPTKTVMYTTGTACVIKRGDAAYNDAPTDSHSGPTPTPSAPFMTTVMTVELKPCAALAELVRAARTFWFTHECGAVVKKCEGCFGYGMVDCQCDNCDNEHETECRECDGKGETRCEVHDHIKGSGGIPSVIGFAGETYNPALLAWAMCRAWGEMDTLFFVGSVSMDESDTPALVVGIHSTAGTARVCVAPVRVTSTATAIVPLEVDADGAP